MADPGGIALEFELAGEFDSADRYGSGHIHDTYLINTRGNSRYILQRINTSVFTDPVTLMANIERVTEHIGQRTGEGQRNLSLVRTLDNTNAHVDDTGAYWRMFPFLEGTRSYDSAPSPAHAREAAREFGRFQAMMRDLPGPRLHETIANFHNTPARYAQLHDALASDAHHRARGCAPEIEQALGYEEFASSLVALHEAGEIPERITHNDTKINNVLFDVDSDKAVCVIDLDTVMPGLALYDFGDMVRTATTTAAEDETDSSLVVMRMDYYEALADGYLDATRDLLNDAELENLAIAGKVITIETGVRFLTDYLRGDEYFRIRREGQNLDRCRSQFALVASIDDQLGEMQQLTLQASRARR